MLRRKAQHSLYILQHLQFSIINCAHLFPTMPTYAVFGATGNVGTALMKVLLDSSDNHIHAYCRSRDKLEKLVPEVSSSRNVQTFEGSADDIDLLASCLRGTKAAFLALAPPGNQPGGTLVYDFSTKIIAALKQLRTQQVALPKLIVLSSASTEHRLMAGTPKFLLGILYRAFHHTYEDLKAAEQLLKSEESLVSATFIKPGALTDDKRNGFVLSFTEAKSPLSFLDLAAGMVEVGQDISERYDGKSVAVNATGSVRFPREAPSLLLRGLIVYFVPFMYRFIG
jgi:putative NADH-flavin reductase